MINNDFYAIIDTETGGLHPQNNPICEIAFVVLNNKLEEVDRYSAINKGYNNIQTGEPLKYDQRALDVHGISMKEINAGISIEQSVKNMDEIFSKYSKKTSKVVLVGHNMDFDMKMLRYAYAVCKKDITKYTFENVQDTLKISHMAWGHDDSMENFKLPTCCERIGVSIADSHRALGDVLSTVKLFQHHVLNLRSVSQAVVKQEPKDEYSRSHTFRF